MSNLDDNSKLPPELIKDGLELLTDAGILPDISKAGEDKSAPSEQTYLQGLDADVHSLDSLESSRTYCIRLLELVPEIYSKTAIVVKLIDQEVLLQESIKKRSYSDKELISKVRRLLALGTGFGALVLCGAAFTYAAFHKANITDMLGFARWMLGYATATVFVFYFPGAVKSFAALFPPKENKNIPGKPDSY